MQSDEEDLMETAPIDPTASTADPAAGYVPTAHAAWAPPAAPLPSRVSRRGYAVAGIIALLGLVIGLAGLVRGFGALSDRVDAFQRVDVPGTGEVQFTEAGDFTLYYEAAGVSADDASTAVPSVQIGIVSAQGDKPVSLDKYGGSATYSFGGHEGRAVATFHIADPGTYVVASAADIEPGSAQLAVGGGLGAGFAQIILPALVLVLALLAAVVLAIVTAVRRHRARTGATSAAHAYGLTPPVQ